MRLRNRNRYRNSVRLPVILFFVIVGGLVGTRWVKEVRAQHVAMHLSTEVRELEHSLTTMRQDIQDLKSRYSALVTEDELKRRLKKSRINMHDIATSSIISLETEPPTNFAANLDH